MQSVVTLWDLVMAEWFPLESLLYLQLVKQERICSEYECLGRVNCILVTHFSILVCVSYPVGSKCKQWLKQNRLQVEFLAQSMNHLLIVQKNFTYFPKISLNVNNIIRKISLQTGWRKETKGSIFSCMQ